MGRNIPRHWEVRFTRDGPYEVQFRFNPFAVAGVAPPSVRRPHLSQPIEAGAATCVFAQLPAQTGPGRIETWMKIGPDRVTPRFVDVR